MLTKVINFCKENSKDIFLALIIFLTAIISFGLGRLSRLEEAKTPITIEQPTAAKDESSAAVATKIQSQNSKSAIQGGEVVASKNGTKYHFPWCAGAQSIKAENKITFPSAEEARKTGYTPASNCKGLK